MAPPVSTAFSPIGAKGPTPNPDLCNNLKETCAMLWMTNATDQDLKVR